MHVRVAPPGGGPRLTAGRARSRSLFPIPLALLIACLAAGACRGRATAPRLSWESSVAPSPAAPGPATVTVRAIDEARRPVRGARLRVEGHMSHPGMAPVLAAAHEVDPGVYQADLHFTMAGDWILLVDGTLATGEAVQHRIDVQVGHTGNGK